MKQYKEIPVQTMERQVASITCDGCREVIVAPYFEVETGHSDWGNDSRESWQEYQFCSVGCVTKHMTAYFKQARETEEYNVERRRSAP